MNQPDLIIANAVHKGQSVDLAVAGGRVAQMAPGGTLRSDGAEVLNASGLMLLPGLMDAHTHLREPGQTHKEDMATGLSAAAHGGFARIMCMANTSPVNDEPEITRAIRESAAAAWPDGPVLHPIAALTKGLAGREIADFAAMREAGCAAVSNDGVPVADSAVFREALIRARAAGLVLIDHCEDPHMAVGAGVNLGRVSEKLGLEGQPASAEAIQVARDVLLAAEVNAQVHLAHISCRQSVEVIAWAKKQGMPVTAETCPHFLILTEDEVERTGAMAKVNPPLRPMDDVLALRQALREGVIDCLATDHAPHSAVEKARPFVQAPCGISGLDTALAVTLELVRQGELAEADAVRAWHDAPAGIFGLPSCVFAPGDPADLALVDPEEEWAVSEQTLFSKGKNTPLLGRTLRGRVRMLLVAGKRVV
jgi:dihydroorotase